jgi:NAD(P)-dependent dehydrogenase (short-subunit alcohol dehydrogenase family)
MADSVGENDVLGYRGKRVVIAGAATGMGAATAQILLDLGAEVIALDIKGVQLPVQRFLAVDLRDKRAIDAAVAQIQRPLHAVFSCAGLPGAPFSDLEVMLVNFVGARHLIESLVPNMPAGSAVATIASTAGMGWQQNITTWMGLLRAEGFEAGKAWCEAHPEAIASGYVPSKQVMNAWVCWRAATLIRQGIRLNTLNPGPTDTPMMPAFEKLGGGAHVINIFTQPINRRSTPAEQAWPLVMLNSPRASYVTGHAFHADGGWFGGVQTGQIELPTRPN